MTLLRPHLRVLIGSEKLADYVLAASFYIAAAWVNINRITVSITAASEMAPLGQARRQTGEPLFQFDVVFSFCLSVCVHLGLFNHLLGDITSHDYAFSIPVIFWKRGCLCMAQWWFHTRLGFCTDWLLSPQLVEANDIWVWRLFKFIRCLFAFQKACRADQSKKLLWQLLLILLLLRLCRTCTERRSGSAPRLYLIMKCSKVVCRFCDRCQLDQSFWFHPESSVDSCCVSRRPVRRKLIYESGNWVNWDVSQSFWQRWPGCELELCSS